MVLVKEYRVLKKEGASSRNFVYTLGLAIKPNKNGNAIQNLRRIRFNKLIYLFNSIPPSPLYNPPPNALLPVYYQNREFSQPCEENRELTQPSVNYGKV